MELREYLRVVRRRWALILACTMICLGAGGVATLSITPQYASNARLFVSTTPSGATEAYQGGLFSAERVTSYSDLATSRELAELVIDDLDLNLSPGELTDKVTSHVVPETVILELTVQDPDPARAQALTQSYAEQLRRLIRALETPQGERTRRSRPRSSTTPSSRSRRSLPTSCATSRSRPSSG